MFNGIVEATGNIEAVHEQNGCRHFTLSSKKLFDEGMAHDLKVDDSISVNGICLTVTEKQPNTFDVTAVPETLRLTNLQFLTPGSRVNLERAMLSNSRISGHYVQGHVDALGEILTIQHEGDALLVKIGMPASLANYIVNKGYITLDGMSITVIRAEREWFTVTFIPHTQKATIVSHYNVGTPVNIEVDILGKYVEKILGARQ